MAMVDLVMPKMGESIMEATILKWHKNPGDYVKMDETLLEIATDKVDSEVPSTAEGTLEEVLFQVNDVVSVGTVIARIRTGQEATSASAAPAPTPTPESNEVPATENTAVVQEERPVTNGGARFYSPLVLNIAGSEGVSLSELENIPGSGNDGRVTKKDILQYVADKKAGNVSAPKSMEIMVKQEEPRRTPETSAPVSYSGNVEIIEMDRMRKMISKHMIESTQTSAHVTSFSEADVTNMVLWRERVKKDFEKREGEKITFTPLFVEAVVRCIKKFPWLNSSVEGDKIIVKKDINIGMAAALPNGNLIVPVIKGADQLNLVGLTKQVNQLANAARNNKLKPDDTAGGTFTLTNVGTFGSIMGTPIINQPQVAILAVGAIKKRPVVIETEQGDSIAIRHMMYLSLSYDHRIIDGGLGSTFLNAVTKELENFNPEKEW
ncbi:dihydrolipoamide acetyltransferase family protein [Parasegetibacter sp. NRK P23]|uniref:dihydrolipoamide acetyltransferase family protein n=1 Tax=Parasegetibacter sp. NRK P23 TaxID=2942999 RepID=UPI00204336A4|nr:dihydrolipoamide acetyltransferase family protein [Parasegetibacter sp. NRK P23]MCM5528071.1 2-oxo acid dehydrogenase subunit E2 [Parasegetibacter sp. NRK P23]